MKSTIGEKGDQKGIKNVVKMPIFYNNVYKHLMTVQNMVLSGKYHSRRQIERYILPCWEIVMDLLVQTRIFGPEKGSQYLFSTMVTKHLLTVQNFVLWGIYHFS